MLKFSYYFHHSKLLTTASSALLKWQECIFVPTAIGSPGGLHPELQISCQPRGEGLRPGSGDQPTWAVACSSRDLWRPVCVGGLNYSPGCCLALREPGDLSSPAAAGNGTCQHASMYTANCQISVLATGPPLLWSGCNVFICWYRQPSCLPCQRTCWQWLNKLWDSCSGTVSHRQKTIVLSNMKYCWRALL